MKTIILALRSPLLRDCIRPILTKASYSVIGEVSDFGGGVAEALSADVIIVDASLWAADIGLSQRVCQTVADRIVVLGNIDDLLCLTLDQVLAADGILSVDATTKALIQSLLLVQTGERVIPRELMQSLMTPPAPGVPEPQEHQPGHRALSPREGEMVRHLARGSCTKIIARELGIAEATVKVHLKNLYCKLRVANRTQAALWGRANEAA